MIIAHLGRKYVQNSKISVDKYILTFLTIEWLPEQLIKNTNYECR